MYLNLKEGTPLMTTKLLTAKDVAERLSISKAKAFTLLNEGILPAIHIGRNIRVEEQDLEAYILNNKISNKMTMSERNITKII